MEKQQVLYSIRQKGSILARELKSFFYDNIKVKYNANVAYRYVEWALLNGFKEKDIKSAFLAGLEQRHADATDLGLSSKEPTVIIFELSSTVSFAKERLMQRKADGKIGLWGKADEQSQLDSSKANRIKW